jgi:hypothetical protein
MAAVGPTRWGKTIDQPFRETFHLVHLTRHVLDPLARHQFDLWLKDAIARIDEVALRPVEQERDWASAPADDLRAYIRLFRGTPIPPAIFAKTLTPEELPAEFAAFATKARLEANPYIRPDQHLAGQ